MANLDSTSATPFDNTQAASVALVSSSTESVNLRITSQTPDKPEMTLKLDGSFSETGAVRYLTAATLAEGNTTLGRLSFSLFVPTDPPDFSGTLRADRLWASLLSGDDWFTLGSGADRVNAFAGDDYLNGGGGNDWLQGGDGNDIVDGGSGIDTAVFAGMRSGYTLTRSGDTVTVRDNTGTEGRDTLLRTERVQFSDARLALDLDGAAGNTAKLLGAVFGAASVQNKTYVGIGLQLFDAGRSMADVADLALNVALGANHTNADVVNLLWRNLMGSTPDAAQADPFIGMLARGEITAANLTVIAAGHSANLANIGFTGLQASGIEYL